VSDRQGWLPQGCPHKIHGTRNICIHFVPSLPEGKSCTKVLQEVTPVLVFIQTKLLLIIVLPFQMFTKKKDKSSAQSTISSVRHSQLKVLHNKWNPILDTGHPAGWVNCTTECEDTALERQDWRSEVYVPATCSEYVLTFTFLKLAVSKLFNSVRWTVYISHSPRFVTQPSYLLAAY
jgi:hypothetical protein